MIIAISGKINSGKDTIGKILQILLNNPHLNNEGVLSFMKRDIYSDNPYYKSWQIKKFADKLKDIVCLLIGCTREQLEDREFKEKELGEEWWQYKYLLHKTRTDYKGNIIRDEKNRPIRIPIRSEKSLKQEWKFITKNFYEELSPEQKEYHNAHIIKLTPRLMLQLFGTECGRQIIHPNVWVNALMSEYTKKFTGKTFHANGIGRVVQQHEYPNWIITDMRFSNELKAVEDKKGITIRVNRSRKVMGNPRLLHTTKSQHESEIALDNAEFDYVIQNNGTLEDLIDKVREIIIKEKL